MAAVSLVDVRLPLQAPQQNCFWRVYCDSRTSASTSTAETIKGYYQVDTMTR